MTSSGTVNLCCSACGERLVRALPLETVFSFASSRRRALVWRNWLTLNPASLVASSSLMWSLNWAMASVRAAFSRLLSWALSMSRWMACRRSRTS